MKLQYFTKTTVKGNEFYIHSTHIGAELMKNIPIAAFLVDKYGGKLFLLPNNITNKITYKKLMPLGVKIGKHPDCFWENEIWEFKTNTTGRKETIKQEIKDGHKQSDNLIIRFDFENDVSNKVLYRIIKGQILATKTLNKVWVWKNGKLIKFERGNLIKKPCK